MNDFALVLFSDFISVILGCFCSEEESDIENDVGKESKINKSLNMDI